jgi:hypothetical protein
MSEDQRRVIPVHIASSEIALGGAAVPGGRIPVTIYHPKTRTEFFTVTLTANDPVQAIAPISEDRAYLVVNPVDASIVISDNQAGAALGTGAIVSMNSPWMIFSHGVVFAAPLIALTGSSTARVSGYCAYEL